MSRNSLFDALSGKSLRRCLAPCMLLALPVDAAEDDGALALPSTAITGAADVAPQPDQHTPTTSGSRLGLTALETPASVTSMGAEQVLKRNNATVQDAVTRSPGITFIGTPGNGGTALSARGFAGHASTMQLFDGNRLYVGAGTVTFPVDTWSVERIDILRGPASVLYGEGATGAVINVVPKKPFEGDIRNRIRLGYGSDDRRQAALDSGGSLSDSLSYRLNLNQQASNGWVDRGDSQSLAVSAALRWDATDNLSFTLSHDHGDQEPMQYFGTPLVNGRFRESLRDNNYNVADPTIRYNDQSTRLVTDWTISENLSASNQLYFLKMQRRWRNAETYAWQPGDLVQRSNFISIKQTQEQIGDRQTFTLKHSLFGLDSQTVFGADYNAIRFVRKHDFGNTYSDTIGLGQSGGGDYVSTDPYRSREANQARQFSLFAENRTQLTEQLSLITGVRRDQVHLNRDDLLAGTRSDRSLSGGNWRAGLVFAVTEDLSLYGQYATSTEGVSNLLTLTAAQQQWDLSTAKQTELGIKQQFLEGNGEWTLAAYHIVKKKLLSADPLNPAIQQQVGQQSADGIEATLELRLPHDVQLSANASWVRAEYDEFISGSSDFSGNQPLNVPRRSANLWLSKDFAERFSAGAGARYVDSRYGDNANTVEVPSYTVVDANFDWHVQPDLTLGLQLNNLFDRQYATTTSNNGRQWYLGEPRSFFVTADYSF
ncbi:TonB-dependent siderophore receptor [Pseudomonas sp. PA15(2017)]|uniref:TonB-dependent receptor n=1 Tax=Pseudomonas sp. PA15(2017) TaxID=1932111 RepID=UPI00095AD8A4|nr:TonB-dependent receptor [Pseudomonas sp. PA15(2017)]OLU28198.1 TonB-dependent siderophore receptor [Pseudomonas sp. PA15(2017)]